MDRIIPTKKEAQKWANALRSGKYEQGRSQLQDGDSFCCLGVACIVFIPKDKLLLHKSINSLVGGYPMEQPNAPLWLKNINSDLGKVLGSEFASLNDSYYYTFDEIADIIELVYVHKAI